MNTPSQPKSPIYVCSDCGGTNLFRDAYVAVNDPDDARSFDIVVCEDCGNAGSNIMEEQNEEDDKEEES